MKLFFANKFINSHHLFEIVKRNYLLISGAYIILTVLMRKECSYIMVFNSCFFPFFSLEVQKLIAKAPAEKE